MTASKAQTTSSNAAMVPRHPRQPVQPQPVLRDFPNVPLGGTDPWISMILGR